MDCKKEFARESYIQYRCNECQVIVDKEEARNRWIIHIKHKLQLSKIPNKYIGFECDVSNYPLGGYYLWGKAGVGKTVLACAILKTSLLETNITGRFVSLPSLVMELQDSFRKDSSKSSYDILKELANIPVLLLDDLGAEKMTDFVAQSIYYLINEREMNDRATIITSNYSLGEILDGRVASRIAGMCKIIELKGKDKRIKQ